MAIWNTILTAANLVPWVAAHEGGRDVTELQRWLLEERFRGPVAAHKHPGAWRRGAEQAVASPCDPADVVLSEFPQWQDERGYWVGEYDFYASDGEPYQSVLWPYPYKSYRGFITGNVVGPAYRQRNVFVYRPLAAEECDGYDGNLTGMFHGACGTNGNTKLFQADQEVTDCEESAGDGGISGPYAGVFSTQTELVGDDNALLYQVTLPADAFGPGVPPSDCLLQSQLTTLTRSGDGAQVFRTRSAQSFECFNPATIGQPTSLSFYRERKVDREEFVAEMADALAAFNVTEGDTCAWENDATNNAVPSPYHDSPGIEACMLHLNESFALGEEGDAVGGAQAENSSAEETGDEAVQSQATNETAGEENSVEETVDKVDELPATNETSEEVSEATATLSSTLLLLGQGFFVLLLLQ